MSHLFVTNCFPASQILLKALYTQAFASPVSSSLNLLFWLLVTLPFSETQPSVPVEMAFLPFKQLSAFSGRHALPPTFTPALVEAPDRPAT